MGAENIPLRHLVALDPMVQLIMREAVADPIDRTMQFRQRTQAAIDHAWRFLPPLMGHIEAGVHMAWERADEQRMAYGKA